MPELDLDAIAARRAAVPGELDGPWFLSDCDGTLQIWLEAVLRNVTRDETGRITGYRLPASFRPTDLIAEWDLEYWDEGVDEDDDKRRALAEFIAHALQDVDDLLAEVKRLREQAEQAKARHRDPDDPSRCPICVRSWGDEETQPHPCPTYRDLDGGEGHA